MTLEEYFGDWIKVIDRKELNNIILKLQRMKNYTPNMNSVFRAFELCRYNDMKVIFLGYDPYPQKGVATGILFGNSKETKEEDLSPSLKIVRDAAIDLHVPHNSIIFDQTLESWAKRGILMINSALTVEINKVGSHTMLWRPFISKLLRNISSINTGIIYVLFGRQAQTFKPYIGKLNDIIEIEHPAYFARTNKEMPSEVFYKVNELLKNKYGSTIQYYQEL